MILFERKFLFGLIILALVVCVRCQDEEEAPAAEEPAPDAPEGEEAAGEAPQAAADGEFP